MTSREDTCKGCGATILWVRMPTSGRSMPLDSRVKVVITDKGQVVTGRESHFATCPKADAFRASREVRP